MNNNHFNTAARSWDTDETIRRNASFADAIKKYIPKEGKLKFLDFGCGTGLLSSHFIGRADSLVGIDTSTGMLEQFDL